MTIYSVFSGIPIDSTNLAPPGEASATRKFALSPQGGLRIRKPLTRQRLRWWLNAASDVHVLRAFGFAEGFSKLNYDENSNEKTT